MEIELKKEQLDGYRCVYADTVTREESMETVVPDVMPDVGRVVGASADFYLRSKELEPGTLTVTGELTGEALYVPEGESSLRRLSFSSPCTFRFEDAAIGEENRALVSVCCGCAEAKVLNSRKLQLCAALSLRAEVYDRVACVYAVAAEEESLQTRCETVKAAFIASVEEKTFVISEEFALPSASGAMHELLAYHASAWVEETKLVGGKLILQGSARLDVLSTAGEETRPIAQSFSTPFSQIMDAPEEENCQAHVELVQTACFVEPVTGAFGTGGVNMEMYLVAQAVCCAEREVHCLTDAYSWRFACDTAVERLTWEGLGKTAYLHETLRDLLETPDTASESLWCTASCGLPRVNGAALAVPVCLQILYATDRGILSAVRKKMDFKLSLPGPGDVPPRVESVRCGELYVSANSGGLEIRLPVDAALSCFQRGEIPVVSAVRLDRDAPLSRGDQPSVMIVRGGGDLWSLAKRYRSTPELIASANPQGGEAEFLMIPRAR